MAEFSLFPTAHWAEKQAQGIAVRWKKGNSAFFSSLPEQITWQQWHELVQNGAALLQQRGILQGDLVAYCGTHRLTGLLCYLAALRLGASILMLNPAMTEIQRSQIMAEMGIKQWLNDADFAKNFNFLTRCQPPEPDFSAPATLTLTSGSSGQPKAVVHSIQNHLDNAVGVCELMNFHSNNSWLLSLPLFHVSGQGIVWRWLSQGATLVIAEDKSDFYSALAQVSHASLVPTQLQRYLAQAVQFPPQKILLGGAILPADLISSAEQKGLTIYSGYGMTEMASTICAGLGGGTNVGKPLTNREIRLENGEIWVRGAGLGLGYWLNQQLVPLTNSQGWLQTKDKGEWQDGNLLIVGRLDNQFISGGENIQPEQIERVLLSSTLLKQAYVLPVASEEFGFQPVAVVEFIDGFSPQRVKILQEFAKNHLEKFKLPTAYFPLEWQAEVKISRKQLQQRIKEKYDI